MATKKDFSCEFWLFFRQKTTKEKLQKITIKTYLQTSKRFRTL